jgi:hypothetical protein
MALGDGIRRNIASVDPPQVRAIMRKMGEDLGLVIANALTSLYEAGFLLPEQAVTDRQFFPPFWVVSTHCLDRDALVEERQ